MKRFMTASLALLALSSCQYTEYYAEGVSIADRDRDLAICRAEAREQYPPRVITLYSPPEFHPETTLCDAENNCVTTEAYWEPGQPYTEDLNEDARRDAIVGCMARRGYTRVQLPLCEAGEEVRASTVMQPLTSDSCILRYGGQSLVVNP